MRLTRSVVILILGIVAISLSLESNAELDSTGVVVSQNSQNSLAVQ